MPKHIGVMTANGSYFSVRVQRMVYRATRFLSARFRKSRGEKFDFKMISSGKGRTTCPFFTKDGKHIIYASTHLGSDSCPPVPDRRKYGNKYIWPLYESFDIFMADLNGKIVKQLTNAKGYDAEATLSPDGKK